LYPLKIAAAFMRRTPDPKNGSGFLCFGIR